MDDVFEMLKADHETVRRLYKQSKAAGGPMDNGPIFDQIKRELDQHTHIEETIFYPACEKHVELKRLALERYEEHNGVKELLFEMGSVSGGGAGVDDKLRVIMQRVEEHVRDEEERLFPLAQKVMRRSELATLAGEIDSARRRLGTGSRGAGSR